MRKELNIGSIQIPKVAATKAFALLAKRGAGKSYTGAVMAEEFAKHNIPFVVFDPIDVWWGLRLSANGKGKGLPIVVFGLQHADILLTRDMGRKIAREIVKENISCVISTFGMPKVAQRELIADFSEELLNINNTPRHVFIEEAHEFVPQRVFGAMGRCFAAVESLLVMGRNRGIGVTLLNQRAATINKDLLSQIDTLIALRSVGPQDRKALKDWVEAHSADGDFEQFIKTLPSLPTGEAWIWSPEFLEIFKRVKIRKRETFHPDREKLGMTFKMPEIKQGDIQSFVEKFNVKEKQDGIKKVVSKAIVLGESMADYKRDSELKGLIKMNDGLNHALKEMIVWLKDLNKETQQLTLKLSSVVDVIKKEDGVNIKDKIEVNNGVDEDIGLCAKKIYSFLHENSDKYFSRVQLATVTGYSFNSGGFKNAISKLNAMGLIHKQGDLLGCKESNKSYVIKTEKYTPEIWFDKLGKCSREIFRLLWQNPDKEMTRDFVGLTLGYSVNSGGFKNSISQLSSLGLLVRKNNNVQLNPELLNL